MKTATPTHTVSPTRTSTPTHEKPHKEFVTMSNNVIDPTKNQKVVLQLHLKERTNVRITVYDIDGNKVAVLMDEMREGSYKTEWNGKNERDENVSSGVYLIAIETDRWNQTKKVMVVK